MFTPLSIMKICGYYLQDENTIFAAFRNLHRARREVFKGDEKALSETRQKINDEFRMHLQETDISVIEEKLALAKDVAFLLRGTVVQLQQKDDDTFGLRITENTIMQENTAFDPSLEIPAVPRIKKCSDTSEPGT